MMSTRHPVIGITRSRSDPPDPAIFGNYAQCVERAGGRVRWIRPGAGESAESILGEIDGLVLTGGPDVDPSHYGQPQNPHTRVSDSSRIRDGLEIPLVQRALQQDKPVLAICRGMQVLNVALGGSLRQHIEGHAESPDGASAYHPVSFTPESRLARLMGISEQAQTNSRHHQALDRIGRGLTVVATSPEGIVEAVESAAHRWAFGVQCHPERVDEAPPEMQRLFSELVQTVTESWLPPSRAY